MPEIGATLRETRMRERIDLSEIEAKTKIRARYLRALENEEWDLLPGPTFIRTFLRTYAEALGLDGKALVQEYRTHFEHQGEAELRPPISSARRRAGEGGEGGRSHAPGARGYAIAIGVVSLVVVLLLIGLLSGGSKPRAPSASSRTTRSRTATRTVRRSRTTSSRTLAARTQASVWLQARETVWVCLVGPTGKDVIPGVDVHAGEHFGPYRGSRFEITLGNNALTLRVNGRALPLPASSTALGYVITRSGARSLEAGSQPTCG